MNHNARSTSRLGLPRRLVAALAVSMLLIGAAAAAPRSSDDTEVAITDGTPTPESAQPARRQEIKHRRRPARIAAPLAIGAIVGQAMTTRASGEPR